MRSLLSIHLLLFALAVTAATNSSSAGNDPHNYFGGLDHEDYLDWAGSVDYAANAFLANPDDSSQGIAIHWSISDDEEYVDLGLAVRATGWLGFGLSDNGVSNSPALIRRQLSSTIFPASLLTPNSRLIFHRE